MKFFKFFALTLLLTAIATPFPAQAGKKPGTACYSVDSRQGWQYLNLYGHFSRIVGVGREWTTDAVRLDTVGSGGYEELEAKEKGQEVLPPAPYDSSFPYGALLVGVPGQSYSILDDSQTQFSEPLDYIALRINEDNSALPDNVGSLEVCFGN
jgi:hypothetical protein